MAPAYEAADVILVRDVQTRLQDALQANLSCWAMEHQKFVEEVLRAESAPPNEREIGRTLERLADAWYERAGVFMGVYNSFARTDERFRWRMGEQDWTYISESSNIYSDDARLTLEGLITFEKVFIPIASAAPPSPVQLLMDQVTEFLRLTRPLLSDEAVRQYFSSEDERPGASISSPETFDVMQELNTAIAALDAISLEFPHIRAMSRNEITEQLVEDLSMFVSHYAHRPISSGSATNKDLDWMMRVFRLVGHSSDGLPGAIKAFIRGRRSGNSESTVIV